MHVFLPCLLHLLAPALYISCFLGPKIYVEASILLDFIGLLLAHLEGYHCELGPLDSRPPSASSLFCLEIALVKHLAPQSFMGDASSLGSEEEGQTLSTTTKE